MARGRIRIVAFEVESPADASPAVLGELRDPVLIAQVLERMQHEQSERHARVSKFINSLAGRREGRPEIC